MNNLSPIYIPKDKLTDLVNNNCRNCRYNEDIQIIYRSKKDYSTRRHRAHHIKIWSSWLNPIVTYLPLTVQYKNKYIPIICHHRNT